MKTFLVSTAKDFGLGVLGALVIFCYAFGFVLLILFPFCVPMYVDSLVVGHLGLHWIFILFVAAVFVEFAVVRIIEGE